ncbi:MAG: hypothetical protein GY721_13780 [Deltaproteobacteria bacterium]|nr:hypothetical protein [Deltaproteobacteria bacterium]
MDSIQVIKGWVDKDSILHEKIYLILNILIRKSTPHFLKL